MYTILSRSDARRLSVAANRAIKPADARDREGRGARMDELRFDGRVVAITGAAQGMGREYALLLAQRGARLVVNDIKGAEETIALVRERGGEAIENRSDITDPAQTDRIVRDALDAWGRLDAVINNAAAYGGTLPDPETAGRVIGVHLMGTINVIRSAMPTFRAQKYGRILNVGSGSMFGLPGVGTYAAGKGGVFGFTRSLAKDLERDAACDIKANLILPAAFTPAMPRVPDPALRAVFDTAFTSANIAPLAALLVHEACPAQGEALHVGGGRQARIVLATTQGWQAPDDAPTPESILDHWSEVTANLDPRETVGSMSDLLGRRGLHPYSVMELMEWAQTGQDPTKAAR
jgi:NAD(P)-dependent dehydrogenase (short-subunit alcohol dehydrogenase family)